MVRAAIVLLALFLTLTTWLLSPPRGAAFTPGKLAPDISGGPWINSQPLALADLKERVWGSVIQSFRTIDSRFGGATEFGPGPRQF